MRQHIGQDIRQIGLIIFQQFIASYPIFRTEFVYLNCKDFPTEDYQFEAYKQVVESLAPRKVVVRTCDIGADKTVDYMKLDHEENPALGYRAIRICLTRRDFFKTQLRALLRASAYGNMSIMFPMITSLRELQDAKAVLEECRAELTAEGVKMGQNIEVGTMIETPAAVLIADELAAECDFFSIGTNDLTQYTCALDRQNAKLEPFFNPHHPAVLRAIKMTIEAGHRHGIWVGICRFALSASGISVLYPSVPGGCSLPEDGANTQPINTVPMSAATGLFIFIPTSPRTRKLIQAFLGPIRAGFYQAFAALFGASLTKKYDAEGTDRMNVRLDLGRDFTNKQNLFYFNMTEAF